jgi:hypothetical protein
MTSFGAEKGQKYMSCLDQPGMMYCTEVEVELFHRNDQLQ